MTQQLRIVRRVSNWLARVTRRISLSQRFFLIALSVVLAAMVVLGNWASAYVSDSITKGVGGTAAASIEALISHSLDGAMLATDRRAAFEAAFQVGNSSDATRLLQIRVRDTAGEIVFESLGGLEDVADPRDLSEAAAGVLNAHLVDVPLRPVDGLPRSTLPVIKIYTPLRRADTTEIFGVAELYFSAMRARELQAQARSDVWIIAAVIGIISVGALALLVDVTGEIITRQRQRLAANLRESRALLKQNMALRAASDQLRVESSLANEHVLAQVGSDIHDGPVQLLTLLILRLTRSGAESTGEAAISGAELAREALEDLRGISAGLVLPELATLDIGETITLAMTRHENLTGTHVGRELEMTGTAPASLTAKICAYRVVQEALNNAYRHGGGLDQLVRATVSNGWLRLLVTNRMTAGPSDSSSLDQTGLRAMRFRVESQDRLGVPRQLQLRIPGPQGDGHRWGLEHQALARPDQCFDLDGAGELGDQGHSRRRLIDLHGAVRPKLKRDVAAAEGDQRALQGTNRHADGQFRTGWQFRPLAAGHRQHRSPNGDCHPVCSCAGRSGEQCDKDNCCQGGHKIAIQPRFRILKMAVEEQKSTTPRGPSCSQPWFPPPHDQQIRSHCPAISFGFLRFVLYPRRRPACSCLNLYG